MIFNQEKQEKTPQQLILSPVPHVLPYFRQTKGLFQTFIMRIAELIVMLMHRQHVSPMISWSKGVQTAV